MTGRSPVPARLRALGRPLWRDRRGGSAVEFAIIATLFITLLLFVLQIGLYDVSKMSLDTGVIKQSEALQTAFTSTTAPNLPSAATLKANVASSSGFIPNSSNLSVEIQPLANLSGSAVAVTDGLANYGAPKTVLAIRARYIANSFVPGFSTVLTAYSSALVRRQSQ